LSKIEVDTVEPQSGTSLTLGASGDTITIPAGATFDSSAATTTLPATVVTTTGTQTLSNKTIDATQLTGTVATSNLGTGTADATTFLRGDNSFASAGITEADQWRLTTSFTGDAAPIASNWERTDTSGWGNIGTGMTQASGIFTFPSTGVYLVSFNFYGSATTAQLYCTASLEVTVNNSTYVPAAYADTQFYGGTSYNTTMLQYFVNVTDVSTHKVRFVIDAVSASTTTIGSSTNTGTGATFIRLGAT
jgi:hypothetical protein